MRCLQARLKQLEGENQLQGENPPDEGVDSGRGSLDSGRGSPNQVATTGWSNYEQRQRMYSYPKTDQNQEIAAFHAQNAAPQGGIPWPTTGNPHSGDPTMFSGGSVPLFTIQTHCGNVVEMTVNQEVEDKVKALAYDIIWPKCKFLSNEAQIQEVCKNQQDCYAGPP